MRWLGFDWGAAQVLRLRLLRPALRVGRAAHPRREGLRRRPQPGRDPRVSRHPDPARPGEPVPRPPGRGEPRPIPPHAGGRVPGWLAGAPGPDRHGLAQPQPARSRHVPDPPRRAPPHGRPVVHLPHVRLRAPAVRLDRAHHALALHPRVRGPPPALRLVLRGARRLPSPADRVRPPQPEPHRALQAAAPRAGRGRPRGRVGRPAHAHPRRAPAPRVHRRKPSGSSASGSAWPGRTPWWTWPIWST